MPEINMDEDRVEEFDIDMIVCDNLFSGRVKLKEGLVYDEEFIYIMMLKFIEKISPLN